MHSATVTPGTEAHQLTITDHTGAVTEDVEMADDPDETLADYGYARTSRWRDGPTGLVADVTPVE